MFIDIILKKHIHGKSLFTSIANHIYVFNNHAYTTKTTPLIFKNKIKMKNDVYRHYIEKKTMNVYV
jgi:Fe-S cluster biosynthesis and repair protein YggX